ncbi:hypothetical protein KKI23_02910 [Patescibacteria group bacterium]|nr:hypothetical protein [Patescibacteria group bacterium]
MSKLMAKNWQCPKCKREFAKKNQMHSCVVFPVQEHFIGKTEIARPLYNELLKKIRKEIGPIKIESLPCCIHLVSHYTFMCVYALKDRIRIHFAHDKKITSKRIDKAAQLPGSKYMSSLDIYSKKEINKELITWLKDSYNIPGRK